MLARFLSLGTPHQQWVRRKNAEVGPLRTRLLQSRKTVRGHGNRRPHIGAECAQRHGSAVVADSAAAGHPQRRARDVRRLVAHQQGDRVRDLARLAGRPSGTLGGTRSRRPASPASSWIRVRTMPGATPTTRMPSSATSWARPIVSASTPAFAAAYWTYSPGDPSVAAPELTLTMHAAASAVRRAEGAHRGACDEKGGGEVEVDRRPDDVDRRLGELPDVQGGAGVVDDAGEPPVLGGCGRTARRHRPGP